ncbi:hypothetical protein ACVWW1_009172 [Bradyrhizobium sp. JR3.5]
MWEEVAIGGSAAVVEGRRCSASVMRGPRRMRRPRLRYSPLSRSDAFALEVPFAATTGDVGEPPSRVSSPKYRKQPHAKEQAAVGTRKSNLTCRANQRYLLLFRNHANAPAQHRTRPSRLRPKILIHHAIARATWRVSTRSVSTTDGGSCSGGPTRVRRSGDDRPSRARACPHGSRRLGSRALDVCYGPDRIAKADIAVSPRTANRVV